MSHEISVVIPTRNRLTLLAQTLLTVLAQDVEMEVVVVDEGSSDGTPEWLAAHPDPRVRTVRHDSPRGLSEARNAGIAAASGEWLAFVDDDDLWLPTKLADQLAAARSQEAHWAYASAVNVSSGPTLRYMDYADGSPSRLPWVNVVPGGGSNAIVRRNALDEAGPFDPSIGGVADWDMSIRLLQVGVPAVVESPLVVYRIHDGNMSKNVDSMLAEVLELDRRYRHLRNGGSMAWTEIHGWLGSIALEGGDRRGARRIAWHALRSEQPGALRRLARALVPLTPRRPWNEPRPPEGLRDRLRPRALLPWPPGMREWLQPIMNMDRDTALRYPGKGANHGRRSGTFNDEEREGDVRG